MALLHDDDDIQLVDDEGNLLVDDTPDSGPPVITCLCISDAPAYNLTTSDAPAYALNTTDQTCCCHA